MRRQPAPRTVCRLPPRSPSLRRRALITTSTTLLPPLLVVAPYVAQQRCPANNLSFAFVQVLQHVEFQLGEIGGGAVADELAAAGVERGVVFGEQFPRDDVGQPAVVRGRPEIVVEGMAGGIPDLGGAVRETGESFRRRIGHAQPGLPRRHRLQRPPE